MAFAQDLRRVPLLIALLLLTRCTGGNGGGGGRNSGNPGTAWLASDVGAVGSPGASQVNPASFSVDASGADIWGSADADRRERRRAVRVLLGDERRGPGGLGQQSR